MTYLETARFLVAGLFFLAVGASGFQTSSAASSHSRDSARATTTSTPPQPSCTATTLSMAATAASTAATTVPSWSDLQKRSTSTVTGRALEEEVQRRQQGRGSAFVQNKLRLFQSNDPKPPPITLYRDHAGWCPYCEKTMLLIEEKEVPINIELVPMRSYGDKPREYMQKVPNGLLPAIEVDGRIITESQVIMELLDQWHPPSEGYKPMLPDKDDSKGWAKYNELARLERELFGWWCTLLFRPEGPSLSPGNMLKMFQGGKEGEDSMSGSMKGFLDCIRKVDTALLSTRGPWFFDEYDYPTMIDFIFISHVERMLASCAYWKGLNLRDPKWNLVGLNNWLDAFDKREPYLAFKSDYYTNVKDIPPQYGPGFEGGFEQDRKTFAKMILGQDGSWNLPLPYDDPLQPLYRGLPLPLCVLKAMDLSPDAKGTYESCDPEVMASACRHMAAWKLAGNGVKVSRFAARGGPKGAKNPRKTFAAELADPYADPDESAELHIDAALRVVCAAMMEDDLLEEYSESLRATVPQTQVDAVVSGMAYLRDRVGVPRDLPLAAARYLRAYLNWGIDILTG